MINFSFFQAGWAHTCVSSEQNILFSQAGPFPRALCSVYADRHHQRFKAMSLDVRNTNHSMWCLMPFWALSWPLLGIADTPQPVPRATVVSYREVSGLGEINFSVWGIVLHCLISPWSSIKLQPVWSILEYVTEVQWSRALVFPLEVPKVFCIPNKIFVLVVSPLVNVNSGTSSRKQSLTLNSTAL